MSIRRSTVGFGMRLKDFECGDQGFECGLSVREVMVLDQADRGLDRYSWVLTSLTLCFQVVLIGLNCLGLEELYARSTKLAGEALAAGYPTSSFWSEEC